MNMEQLLYRLQFEACDDFNRKVIQQKLESARIADTPKVRAARTRVKVDKVQSKTAAIQEELKAKRELAEETKLHAKAVLELREASLTTEERRARDADTLQFQKVFSRVCPEAHPDWRQQAAEEFGSRYGGRGSQ